MEYTITWGGDPEDVCFTTSGQADVDALDAMVEVALADPRWHEGMKILLDHRQTHWSGLSVADLRRRADLVKSQAPRIGYQEVAFVIGDSVDYGISRILAAYLDEDVQFAAMSMTSIDEARDWLRNPPAGRRQAVNPSRRSQS